LILSILGIILVGHVFNVQNARLSISGLTAGLLSGLGYAAYIILNKYAVERKYSPWVISAYALGIGGLILVVFQSPGEQRVIFTTPAVIIWLVILGVVPTLGGAVAFNAGLNYLPASSASIIATLEPVVAITLGWVFFAEKIDGYQIIGSGLIITAVVIIQFKDTKNVTAQA
jgi:drug/metabolite transporter, DME family